MCAHETLKLFKCGDEFLFIHMENRVNAETPRVKFKNSAEEDRRGRARNIDGGNREQNKDLLMKEGGKGEKME